MLSKFSDYLLERLGKKFDRSFERSITRNLLWFLIRLFQGHLHWGSLSQGMRMVSYYLLDEGTEE